MNKLRFIRNGLAMAALLAAMALPTLAGTVHAQSVPNECADPSNCDFTDPGNNPNPTNGSGGGNLPGQKPPQNDSRELNCDANEDCKPLEDRLIEFVNFLSAIVGIAVIGSIIFAGIQYTAAGDNSSSLSAAKARIRNALIALFAYMFMYAFLQWLVPGGVF
jgi:hypothetical protein